MITPAQERRYAKEMRKQCKADKKGRPKPTTPKIQGDLPEIQWEFVRAKLTKHGELTTGDVAAMVGTTEDAAGEFMRSKSKRRLVRICRLTLPVWMLVT